MRQGSGGLPLRRSCLGNHTLNSRIHLVSGVESDTDDALLCDPGYYLPKHVYACRTDEGVIFLDAKHDRYFGLGGAGVAALPRYIRNWVGGDASRCRGGETPASHLEVKRVADNLIDRGLLCNSWDELLPMHRASAPPLSMELPRAATEAHRSLRPIDLVYFTASCTRALWLLKRQPLEAIASRVAAARQGHHEPLGLMEVFGRVQAFRNLRRLFFSEKDRCLLNALSLVLFLQHYGHFPLFVIGVKTRPFGAHSWVQHDQILLEGGDPSRICHFAPILVA